MSEIKRRWSVAAGEPGEFEEWLMEFLDSESTTIRRWLDILERNRENLEKRGGTISRLIYLHTEFLTSLSLAKLETHHRLLGVRKK